ncbi:ribosome small subunit-dependent GTPase A [candidate division KSB1 bacterium]|nr:ribosome small subunit-dependent GTPase A [candidate division KSB1 bacterium]
MKEIIKALSRLGFDPALQTLIEPHYLQQDQVARVCTVDKERYIIQNSKSTVTATLTGKMRFAAESALDLPTTGDWVIAQVFDDDSVAVIHQVLSRKSLLKRKSAGKAVEHQLIAANIDVACIVQSLDRNFNINRLQRYLAMVYEGGITPLVLLSKRDLLTQAQIATKTDTVGKLYPDLQVLPFSNSIDDDVQNLKKQFDPGKTYCLLGSSGVGKTTLLNNLLGTQQYETGEVREKDGRGRHTTSRRQLIHLDNGAMLIDTPGMRELGALEMNEGITHTFEDIALLAEQCRFNDCSHQHETGCAVLQALEKGEISEQYYQNYIKMQKEAAHHERTYLEKRQRDKEFGKLYKRIMKHKIKK